MEGHSLLLAFANDSRDFSLGFEIGRTWAMLYDNDEEFDCEMHADNAEMILRLAEATGRTVHTEQHDEVWVTAFFSAREDC